MIDRLNVKSALVHVLSGLELEAKDYQNGYYKLVVHIKVDNENDNIQLKQVNFLRYLGLAGTDENPFGCPFELAKKKNKVEPKWKQFFKTPISPVGFMMFTVVVLLIKDIFYNG